MSDPRAWLAEIKARASASTRSTYTQGLYAVAEEDLPAMAAALTAVLDLHKPTPGYWGEEVCAECSDDDSRLEYSHPCPTVQAVADALGGDRG